MVNLSLSLSLSLSARSVYIFINKKLEEMNSLLPPSESGEECYKECSLRQSGVLRSSLRCTHFPFFFYANVHNYYDVSYAFIIKGNYCESFGLLF